MDFSSYNFNNKNNNYEYPRDNIKSKKSRKSSPKKKKPIINNKDILQLSLNAINSIFLNNLNSTVSLGFLNLANDINVPKSLNNDIYINSLYDTIDYKIKGNIYKQDKNIFMKNFPNLINLVTNKSCRKINKHEIKIMKLDKDIINIKNKTPTKKIDKHYYFNMMQNYNSNRDTNKHYKNFSENIDNNLEIQSDEKEDIKKSKMIKNYDKYNIYRTLTTNNSREKDKHINIIQNNVINQNKIIAYKKKSPTKKYIIYKTSLNSKEKNEKENNIKISEPKNQISFKNKFIHKIIKTNNSPKNIIIVNKNPENLLKNKNKEIINKKQNFILPSQLPKQTKHEHCQSYNIQSYKPISTNGRNIISNNTKSNNNNVIINNNKKIIVNRNNNKLNKIKYLTLVNVNKNKNITEKNSPNKFLNTQIKKINTQYISPNNKFNKVEIYPKQSNKNKNKYVLLNQTINNSNNSQRIKNAFYASNNKNIQNKSNNNKVFGDDENNIFKVIDYTQIMTPDEFNNSKYSSNSNKLNQISSSHGTNTNQDTDYNSLKKFNNNNNILTNEDLGDNNYFNRGSDINFSFNNV